MKQEYHQDWSCIKDDWCHILGNYSTVEQVWIAILAIWVVSSIDNAPEDQIYSLEEERSHEKSEQDIDVFGCFFVERKNTFVDCFSQAIVGDWKTNRDKYEENSGK